MTIDEATKLLKMSEQAIWLKGLEKEQRKAEDMAIKSLEAWEKIRKEIASDGQSDINAKYVLNLVDKHLAEVSE